MSIEDLTMIRDYFKLEEKRNPTITEIKVIDTYWSDHSRHTTFETSIKEVEIEVNSLNFDTAIGYKNENNEKLKDYFNVDSKVVTNDDIKPGKLEIIIKKKFTDFLEE